jgi:hypothetical protein
MTDQITVKMSQSQKSFAPCPTGLQPAVCVDVIDMGESVEQYKNEPPYLSRKVVLVFQSDDENPETGKRYEPSIEFSATFGPKSKLRKMLGAWRGKVYSDEEAMAGAPLHKLVGVNAMINVMHKTSKQDRVYAVIEGINPPLRTAPKLTPSGYERSEHWATRQKDYAEKVAAFKVIAAPPPEGFDAMPAALQEDDSDLPF